MVPRSALQFTQCQKSKVRCDNMLCLFLLLIGLPPAPAEEDERPSTGLGLQEEARWKGPGGGGGAGLGKVPHVQGAGRKQHVRPAAERCGYQEEEPSELPQKTSRRCDGSGFFAQPLKRCQDLKMFWNLFFSSCRWINSAVCQHWSLACWTFTAAHIATCWVSTATCRPGEPLVTMFRSFPIIYFFPVFCVYCQ